MFALILSWLSPIISGPIIQGALSAYKANLAAGNTTEKIAADLAIKQAWIDSEKQKLEQQIVIAEEGRWWTAIIRPLFALPFIVFNFKIIVWDRMFAHAFTEELSPGLLNLEAVIVAAYFGHAALTAIGRAIARK